MFLWFKYCTGLVSNPQVGTSPVLFFITRIRVLSNVQCVQRHLSNINVEMKSEGHKVRT